MPALDTSLHRTRRFRTIRKDCSRHTTRNYCTQEHSSPRGYMHTTRQARHSTTGNKSYRGPSVSGRFRGTAGTSSADTRPPPVDMQSPPPASRQSLPLANRNSRAYTSHTGMSAAHKAWRTAQHTRVRCRRAPARRPVRTSSVHKARRRTGSPRAGKRPGFAQALPALPPQLRTRRSDRKSFVVP